MQRLAGNDEAVRGQAQARLYQAPVSLLLAQDPLLQHEVFGPLAVLVEVADEAEMQAVLRAAGTADGDGSRGIGRRPAGGSACCRPERKSRTRAV
jgi:hypothetical protein